MKLISLKIPETLEECDSLKCSNCYLGLAQTVFGWKAIISTCFFRQDLVDYEYLVGKYARGKKLNPVDLAKYRETYKPNQKWLDIIIGKYKRG